MRNRRRRTGLAPLAWALTLALAAPALTFAFTSQELWNAWPQERFVSTPAACLQHDELVKDLRALADQHPDTLRLDPVGTSEQGRSIEMLTLGHGPRGVLAWSQMHGDEPSATPALLDLASYLLAHGDDPDVAMILDRLTLQLVPMLNPDGAQVYQRQNAQAIDINRDALNLSTREGQLLKKLRDTYHPVFGFNLHDEMRRRTAGDTGVLVTNSVLAVSGDPENTLTPERERAERACVAIAEALAPHFPGGLARYDDSFNPRAFGDNLTKWGTPVVLIESGGVPAPHPFSDLTRTNFVSILTVLRDLAKDDLQGYDATRYTAIPENNNDDWVDMLVEGGEIRQPGSAASYRADLPFDLLRSDQERAQCGNPRAAHSRIGEIGDGRLLTAGTRVDATDEIVVAPFVVGVQGWRARKWLDAATLSRLASLGVVEVSWNVPERHFIEGEKLATRLAGPARARLSVTVDALPRTMLRLVRRPSQGSAHSLSGIFSSLASASAKKTAAPSQVEAALESLWSSGPTLQARAVLAPRHPASFLVFTRAASSGDLALDSVLKSVWIDGREVGAAQP